MVYLELIHHILDSGLEYADLLVQAFVHHLHNAAQRTGSRAASQHSLTVGSLSDL